MTMYDIRYSIHAGKKHRPDVRKSIEAGHVLKHLLEQKEKENPKKIEKRSGQR
jgi:hypothetical protein